MKELETFQREDNKTINPCTARVYLLKSANEFSMGETIRRKKISAFDRLNRKRSVQGLSQRATCLLPAKKS